MNGRVLVMCASRGRPEALQRMLDSARVTSSTADIIVYVDDDQKDLYAGVRGRYRVASGRRLGPCASLNALAKLMPDYEAYGAMTDDCTFETVGWDQWVLKTAASFKAGIGAIAPKTVEGDEDRMDFPWLTNRWVEVLGKFVPVKTYHFFWDVVLQVMGEQTQIAFAKEDEFLIRHEDMVPSPEALDESTAGGFEPTTEYGRRVVFSYSDAKESLRWIARKMKPEVAKLRAAIAEGSTSEHSIHVSR